MTVLHATAIAFAVTGGEAGDARGRVAIDLPRAHRDRGLVIGVEPLDLSPRGAEVAAQALSTMRAAFAAAQSDPAPLALGKALAAGNRLVREENRETAGDRRVLVGATLIAIEINQLTIAQVPPTQLLLRQGKGALALPPLTSWSPQYEMDQVSDAEPLGFAGEVCPAISWTIPRRGDRIVLCCSAVAQCLAREALAASLNPDESLTQLTGGAMHACLDQFEHVVLTYDLVDAHALCVDLHRPPGGRIASSLGSRAGSETRWNGGTTSGIDTPPSFRPAAGHAAALAPMHFFGLSSASIRTRPLNFPRFHRPTFLSNQLFAPVARAWERIGPGGRRQRELALALRLGVPGAHGVRCYRATASASPASKWRTLCPRGTMLRAPTRALAALLILALLARGGWWAVDYFRFDDARISQLLTTADLSIASAAELPPGTGVDHQLTLAQAALDDAARRGAPLASLIDRQQAIDTARDTAAGIVRLTQLTRIGGLPPELAGQPVRLARRADRLFLVAGGFYEVDTANQRLALLLAPGQTISDLTVGALQSVAWEHDAIRVQDGTHLFTLSVDGLWTGEPLGLGGSQQAWGPLPSGSFAGNFYLLDPTAGQVLRFPAGEMGSRPTAWVDPNDATGIDSAIDMTIDGEIHLLLADGTVLSYYRGEATAHLAIPVLPPVRTPLSLYGGPDTGYLYLADSDGASGRITRFDREGAQIHQLLLPNSNPGQNVVTPDPLSQLGDFVVDESTNSIYFVTNDALWEATIG